jgi:hypothetical protein
MYCHYCFSVLIFTAQFKKWLYEKKKFSFFKTFYDVKPASWIHGVGKITSIHCIEYASISTEKIT